MTSFDITVYGQCCRRHVVGKPVLSNISIVRSCWGICVLNLTMLICSNRPAGCCTWKVYFASHIKQLGLQHGGMQLVTIDREFSDVTAPYLLRPSAIRELLDLP